MTIRRSVYEWVLFAEELAKEHGGILPSGSELMKMRLNTLRLVMYANPERFTHIKQDGPKPKKLAEWVQIAEELARESSGTLPAQKVLLEMGLGALVIAYRKFPDAFKHINRDKLPTARPRKATEKSPAQWVLVAEQLAEENGGSLPALAILKKSGGYGGLINAMALRPELFAHIKRDRLPRARTVDDRVK